MRHLLSKEHVHAPSVGVPTGDKTLVPFKLATYKEFTFRYVWHNLKLD